MDKSKGAMLSGQRVTLRQRWSLQLMDRVGGVWSERGTKNKFVTRTVGAMK